MLGLASAELPVGPFMGILLATSSLVLIASIAVLTQVLATSLLNHLDHSRHIDAFGGLHNPIVDMFLIALAVIWILPPHPWGKGILGRNIESATPPAGTNGAPA